MPEVHALRRHRARHVIAAGALRGIVLHFHEVEGHYAIWRVHEMKRTIDWRGMLRAALKAVWPFVAGAAGGLFSGCSIFGSGVGATVG